MRDSLVIADSSCLILLAKIEELEILKSVYGQIFVTKEIVGEFGGDLPMNRIPSAKAVFEKILETDFRISDRILNEAIKLAGEQP